MRIGSLFSGIGGLEMGLAAAIPNAEIVWQVESAQFPRQVLEKHWPHVKRYADVCMVHRPWNVPGRGAVVAQPLETVDLICGGFPCQDLSEAVTDSPGLAGSRSGLWFEFLRIIRAVGPRWVVIENVRALRWRGLGTVLRGLAESGYDAEWSLLSARSVGAPHLRKRLFVIAWKSAEMGDSRGHGLEGRKPAVSTRGTDTRASVAPLGRASDGLSSWSYGGFPTAPERWERGVARSVSCTMPDRKQRLQGLGNAVVPQCAYNVGRRLLELKTMQGES